MRKWIEGAAGGDDTPREPVFLLLIEQVGGSVFGYQHADVSGIVDVCADQAYASFCDETPDKLTAWLLTDVGPLPVEIACQRDEQMGMVEVSLFYRDPLIRGKAARTLAGKGFYRILGA